MFEPFSKILCENFEFLLSDKMTNIYKTKICYFGERNLLFLLIETSSSDFES